MLGHVHDIDSRVVETINTILHESMDPFNLVSVEARGGEDHDGDPVIFVEARFDLSPRPIESAVVSEMELRLRDSLWALGERRFPHIRYLFDEAQTVARRR